MSNMLVSKITLILLGLYFIIRALRKMPKPIAYTIYGFMLTSTAVIFIMGFYYPETLEQWNETVLGWQVKLKMS